jgi:hypothetical protein
MSTCHLQTLLERSTCTTANRRPAKIQTARPNKKDQASALYWCELTLQALPKLAQHSTTAATYAQLPHVHVLLHTMHSGHLHAIFTAYVSPPRKQLIPLSHLKQLTCLYSHNIMCMACARRAWLEADPQTGDHAQNTHLASSMRCPHTTTNIKDSCMLYDLTALLEAVPRHTPHGPPSVIADDLV